jgi:hypothetical protein
MKCKYCDRDAPYKKKQLCGSHYNKYLWRVRHGIQTDELRSDLRKISAVNCRKCGDIRTNKTTNVLCYPCLLAYNRLAHTRRKKKHAKAVSDYYLKHKATIQEYKRKWWENKHNRDLIEKRKKCEII